MTLVAYHGSEAVKTAILTQLRAHREADQLIQGYGYWKDGKGCAVGCTLRSDNHMEYETRFGIPVAIAHLEDAIFEGLPVDLAREWPERLMAAIVPGRDLTRVHWALLHWLLTTTAVNPGIEHPIVRDTVRLCADLMADLAVGKTPANGAAASAESAARSAERSAAWSAESAAWIAARSAASAARSAESAARSAESAESAARSAESAARSAESAERSAAWSAERSAAWAKISDRLIALIQVAPVAKTA